jgi:hypothetical protein
VVIAPEPLEHLGRELGGFLTGGVALVLERPQQWGHLADIVLRRHVGGHHPATTSENVRLSLLAARTSRAERRLSAI